MEITRNGSRPVNKGPAESLGMRLQLMAATRPVDRRTRLMKWSMAAEKEEKMSNWSTAELRKISETDDLHIAPFREDGITYGTPTWIWSVIVGNAVYVRPYNGKDSRWFQAALRQKAGRITAGGISKEVSFEQVEGDILKQVDDAYRIKYKNSEYMKPMIAARIRACTVKITPLI